MVVTSSSLRKSFCDIVSRSLREQERSGIAATVDNPGAHGTTQSTRRLGPLLLLRCFSLRASCVVVLLASVYFFCSVQHAFGSRHVTPSCMSVISAMAAVMQRWCHSSSKACPNCSLSNSAGKHRILVEHSTVNPVFDSLRPSGRVTFGWRCGCCPTSEQRSTAQPKLTEQSGAFHDSTTSSMAGSIR